MTTPWIRTALRVAGVAGVLSAVIATRVVISSQRELEQGLALRRAADTDAAIVHLRRAARWYAPGNPYSSAALEELGTIAREAEGASNIDVALEAWRAVRASIMATRSFYTPHRSRLHEANTHIAGLMAALPPPAMDAGKTHAALTREHLALLEHAQGPSVGWTLLLLAGFAAWVGGAFALAQIGFDENGRAVQPRVRRWGLVIALGFAAFVLGLSLA